MGLCLQARKWLPTQRGFPSLKPSLSADTKCNHPMSVLHAPGTRNWYGHGLHVRAMACGMCQGYTSRQWTVQLGTTEPGVFAVWGLKAPDANMPCRPMPAQPASNAIHAILHTHAQLYAHAV